jgi:hypothetical protein
VTGGVKSLFRLPLRGSPLPRLVVTEAAIDALSLAAIENHRGDTVYAATGGGMGPGTIAAIETLLVDIARLPDALFCSATDANGPAPITCEKIRHPVRAASASRRGRRLE